MNWYVLSVGLFLMLLRCLYPPNSNLTSQLIEIGLITVTLAYAARPAASGDVLHELRSHFEWQTEKYVLVGMLTLCVGLLPLSILPWTSGKVGTPLALGMVFTLPTGAGIAGLYVFYQLIIEPALSPLLVFAPWLLIVIIPITLKFLLSGRVQTWVLSAYVFGLPCTGIAIGIYLALT